MTDINATIQSYADANCGGDRKRAIYELLHNGEEGSFDRYVDEMDQEDANFTLSVILLETMAVYGGEENFKKQWKAEQLATRLDTSTQEAEKTEKNPHVKKLLVNLGLWVLSILVPAVVMGLLKRADAAYEWISAVQPVLIGLTSIRMADSLRKAIGFCRLKNKIRKLPPALTDYETPDFQACLEFYEKREHQRRPIPVTTPNDAKPYLRKAVIRQIIAVACLPVVGILGMIAIVVASYDLIFWTVLVCAGIVAVFLGQIESIGRSTFRTRDVVAGIPSSNSQYKRYNTWQSLLVLSMIVVGGLHLLAAFTGVFVPIMVLIHG